MTKKFEIQTRYWRPADNELRVDEDGFLIEPSSDGSFPTEGLTALESLREDPVSVLLGESGAGKTHDVLRELDALRNAGRSATYREIATSLLDDDRIWAPALRQPHWVFLDAVERSFSGDLAMALEERVGALSALAPGRLRLRLICQAGVWPHLERLHAALERCFSRVQRWVLTPLRRKDVRFAAREMGVPVDAFLREVHERTVGPFAARPVTLRLLLRTWEPNRPLPRERGALYRMGCVALCGEYGDQRLAQSSNRAYDLLDAARQLAGVMLLSRRYVVTSNAAPNLSHAISMEEAEAALEEDARPFLRDAVLKTDLFEGASEERRWTHDSFATFLAAERLAESGLTPGQLQRLLSDPTDPQGLVLPVFLELAGWLASRSEPFFDRLLSRQPELLLKGDPAATDPQRRQRLVARLLEGADAPGFFETWESWRGLSSLDHPKIAEQLRPWVTRNSRKLPAARYFALRIALACKLALLEGDLVEMAVAREEPLGLRSLATLILAEVGSDAVRRSLEPLARGLPEDREDELKGAALMALWRRRLLSPADLFALLRPPRAGSFFGNYLGFLTFDLEKGLRDDDLGAALAWLASLASPRPHDPYWEPLVQAILVRAWALLPRPEVLEAFVEAVRHRMELHARTRALLAPNGWSEEDDDRRRAVLARLVSSLHERPGRNALLLESRWIIPRDRDWALRQLLTQGEAARVASWAEIAIQSIDTASPEAWRNLEAACSPNEMARAAIRARRSIYERHAGVRQEDRAKRRREERRNLVLSTASVEGRWADLVKAGEPYVPRHSPIWLEANGTQKSQILDAAWAYLQNVPPSIGERVRDGLLAWQLLGEYDPARLEQLDTDHIARWVQPLLGAFALGSEVDERLLDLVQRRSLEKLLQGLRRWLLKPPDDEEAWSVASLLNRTWDASFLDPLWQLVRDPATSVEALKAYAPLLAEHDRECWATHAARLLSDPSQDAARRALSGAQWLRKDPTACWPVLFARSPTEPELVRAIVAEAAHPDPDSWLDRASTATLAGLADWLHREYPPDSDPKQSGRTRAYTPRDAVGNLRSGAMQSLQRRGATEELEALAAAHPDRMEVRAAAARAREISRLTRSVPLLPREVGDFLARRSPAIVRSALELHELVLEAFAEIQTEVRNDRVAALEFWETVRGRPKRPKTEPSLCQVVRRHLERRLPSFVTFAEPVGQPAAQGPGTRLDLVVAATDGERPLHVVIEGTGSWNPNLYSAMETQLVGRYLRQTPYGIYLVFHFDPGESRDAWARAARTQFSPPEEGRKRLLDQAKELGREKGVIIGVVILDGLGAAAIMTARKATERRAAKARASRRPSGAARSA